MPGSASVDGDQMPHPPIDWSRVSHFHSSEFRQPDLLNPQLIYRLDDLRAWIGQPCVILSSWAETGHSDGSQHYQGNAVDVYFRELSLLTQYLAAERFGFGGIGIYPDWLHPGLHLDVRDTAHEGHGARWGRLGRQYVSLEEALLEHVKRLLRWNPY